MNAALQLPAEDGPGPSYSVAAAEHVLGQILVDPTCWDAVCDLRADDFRRPDHAAIWRALADLVPNGQQIDCDAVCAYLSTMGELEVAGGRKAIERLHRDTAPAPTVHVYAEALRSLRPKRAAAGSAGAAPVWPEPVNIFAELSAPPFTARELPSELAAYPALYSQHTGIDATITLTSAVAAAAAAIPDQMQVCGSSSTNYFAQPRLWLLNVAYPGAGKTPGQRAMLEPLWKMHRAQDEEWRRATKDLGADDSKPPRPRVIVGDTTLEALSDVLVDNPRGVLIATDEFDAWLGAMDQYRNGAVGRDRGEWLRLFDGGPHSIERVKRGSVFVPNWGCSILTATTPAAMQRLSRHLPEDGLIQRFIVALARRQEIVTEEGAGHEIEAERELYATTLTRLWNLETRTRNGVVPLSREAQRRFIRWRAENLKVQEALGSLDSALEGHVAKYPTLALRLALTFHCVRTVNLPDSRDRDPAAHPIPLDTLETALAFLHRASQHALALYLGRKGGSDTYELARDIARFLLTRGPTENLKGLQRRDIVQYVGRFRSAEEPTQGAAMRLLADLGWVMEAEARYQKGHPTRYAVNPSIHTRFATLADQERERRAIARERIAQAAEDRRADEGA